MKFTIVNEKQRAKLILFYNYNFSDFVSPMMIDNKNFYLLKK